MKIDRSNILSWAKFLVGWPLALLSIAFVIKFIYDQSSGVNISLSEINYLYLGIGVLCFFIYYLMRSYLWINLIETDGKRISFRENTYRFSISELKRFTPGNIWSFLSRATLFTELGFNKRVVGISMIADIQLVVIGCGLVSLLAIPWILNSPSDLQTQLTRLLPFSLILVAIYFVAIGVIYKKRFGKEESPVGNFFIPGFKLSHKLKFSLLSAITYFIYGVGNFFILISLVNIGFGDFFAISAFFTFALLVGYLTFITPMGLGVREIVVTLGLSSVLSSADAGTVSIFSRIVLIASELTFLGIIFLWEKQAKKS